MSEIKKVGVIGAGTMGAAIAAHLANTGIPSLLLDMPGDGTTVAARNSVAQAGLERALRAKPGLFYDTADAGLITVGNTEDDFARLGECDLVIEAIVERLEAKRQLFARLEAVCAPHAIVASNTSGISINAMADGLSESLRRRLLVMHFFNPVRYMKLLEIVPSEATDRAILESASEFGRLRLGKGVVIAKDTPNFIANRLGIYGFMAVLKRTLDEGYGFDEVDAILGEPMGRANSGIFRTCDLSGLDVVLHVAQGVYDRAEDDEQRATFQPPKLLLQMAEKGLLGEKTGQGFYKKVKGADGGSEIHVLDPSTMEYRPRQKVRFESIGAVKEEADPAARIRGILSGSDRAAHLARTVTLDLLSYAAYRVPEIAENPADVDAAMRWGYRWALGPFQIMDALGVPNVITMLQSEGDAVPPLLEDVVNSGGGLFYSQDEGQKTVFDPGQGAHTPLEVRPSDLTAGASAKSNKIFDDNGGARLIDMGDGVALLEFRTKLNAIDQDIVSMLDEALSRAGRDYQALVIGNDAEDFSVGANLVMLMMGVFAEDWRQVEYAVRAFQDINMAIKYSRIPIVVAPSGRTLGGGCEMVLHSMHARAAAETYMGLVETGVGLIPAGGGCKEMLLRLSRSVPGHGPFPAVRQAFETIATATVATSAAEARKLGFLRPTDTVSIDRERLLYDAKMDAIALAQGGYLPPEPEIIHLPGEGGRLVLEQQIEGMKDAGKISEHDALIGKTLAYVLTGGRTSPLQPVTEQYLLDLEREAFLNLIREPKTLERMQHTLTTGRPLRN